MEGSFSVVSKPVVSVLFARARQMASLADCRMCRAKYWRTISPIGAYYDTEHVKDPLIQNRASNTCSGNYVWTFWRYFRISEDIVS